MVVGNPGTETGTGRLIPVGKAEVPGDLPDLLLCQSALGQGGPDLVPVRRLQPGPVVPAIICIGSAEHFKTRVFIPDDLKIVIEMVLAKITPVNGITAVAFILKFPGDDHLHLYVELPAEGMCKLKIPCLQAFRPGDHTDGPVPALPFPCQIEHQ